jgi:hypothetical protein
MDSAKIEKIKSIKPHKDLNSKSKLKGETPKKLPYLPLSLVNEYEKLAEYYNVSRKARGLEKPTIGNPWRACPVSGDP